MAVHSGWHLKKEVQLSHILTTVAALVAIALWVHGVDKRVDMVEYRITQNENLLKESLHEIQQALHRIEDKLDKKADKK